MTGMGRFADRQEATKRGCLTLCRHCGPKRDTVDTRSEHVKTMRLARVTFLSDNPADLARVTARSLVLQCSEDVIAPRSVGDYVHHNLPNTTFVPSQATGHCPNLKAPGETVAAMKTFLEVRGQAAQATRVARGITR
jgi:pimeloyl-ACP methyl ester carboxylesterase